MKGKLPQLPGKNLLSFFAKSIVESRKKRLSSKFKISNVTEYMNQLAANINIFENEEILKFLRVDYFAKHIVELREMSADHAEKASYSSPSETDKEVPPFQNLGVESRPQTMVNPRNRGLSHDIQLF